MIQLSYQPAFDAFHGVYRLLRLRDAILLNKPLHEDHLRMLDFYLLFPFRIEGIRLLRSHGKFRRLAKQYKYAKPYGDLPDDKSLFGRMQPFQSAALDTLATKELIDEKNYETGTVQASSIVVAEPLIARIRGDNAAQSDLIEFLEVLANEYELLGADGLKARSGLMEYRYDAV